MAAVERPTNFHNAGVELVSLQPFVRELDGQLDRLRERHAAFPSDFTARQIDRLLDEQGSLVGRMLELETIMYPPSL